MSGKEYDIIKYTQAEVIFFFRKQQPLAKYVQIGKMHLWKSGSYVPSNISQSLKCVFEYNFLYNNFVILRKTTRNFFF